MKGFILFDPIKAIKTEYLKYLGWACSDHCAAVRNEAILTLKDLLEDDRAYLGLHHFVENFLGRFIEIACRDIDFDVSLEMISAMRIMQRYALILKFIVLSINQFLFILV